MTAEAPREVLTTNPRELPSVDFIYSLPLKESERSSYPLWEGNVNINGNECLVELKPEFRKGSDAGKLNAHIQRGLNSETWTIWQYTDALIVSLHYLHAPTLLLPDLGLRGDNRFVANLKYKEYKHKGGILTENDIDRENSLVTTGLISEPLPISVDYVINSLTNLVSAVREAASNA